MQKILPNFFGPPCIAQPNKEAIDSCSRRQFSDRSIDRNVKMDDDVDTMRWKPAVWLLKTRPAQMRCWNNRLDDVDWWIDTRVACGGDEGANGWTSAAPPYWQEKSTSNFKCRLRGIYLFIFFCKCYGIWMFCRLTKIPIIQERIGQTYRPSTGCHKA